jgi:hypothetical protein
MPSTILMEKKKNIGSCHIVSKPFFYRPHVAFLAPFSRVFPNFHQFFQYFSKGVILNGLAMSLVGV